MKCRYFGPEENKKQSAGKRDGEIDKKRQKRQNEAQQ